MVTATHKFYGVLERTSGESSIDQAVEEVARLGYTILHSGMDANQIHSFAEHFDLVQSKYIDLYGADALRAIDEHNTIRMPSSLNEKFLELAQNTKLLLLLKRLIAGKFILNQQNGIVNPVDSVYNQDKWHRDLPYQHFTSSRSIAVNALYCVDAFTLENGATRVLPASHLQEAFPSDAFITQHEKKISAPAGAFIVLDCMTYHCGGKNTTDKKRRAVNHLFTIPHIKQQINMHENMKGYILDSETKALLAVDQPVPSSVTDFLSKR